MSDDRLFHSRNDPFSPDILPTNVPPLLHEMPATDRQQLLDEYVVLLFAIADDCCFKIVK